MSAAERRQIRCEPCTGRGYQGRWRQTARGKAWKLETCRSCGGTGERYPTPREQRQIDRDVAAKP